MVAIVGGGSLGLNLGSLAVLGQRGGTGSASTGRNGELAYVNAATGNLVLQRRDDVLQGRGISVESLRTYNSLGSFADDNGDNWTSGLQQLRLVGTANAAGSTFVRTDRDGSQSVYTYDVASARYVATDGGGAHDHVVIESSSTWVRTDGSTGVQERFDASTGRVIAVRDPSGNEIGFAYNYFTGLLSLAVNSKSEVTFYDYSGRNLTQVRTVYTQDGVSRTLTRTRYAYDGSNRLTQVIVDLTPGDNSVADGQAYTTTYTYDGASKRIASVTQSDGTSLSFTYQQIGADYRVASITDALNDVTRFEYDIAARRTTVVDATGLRTQYDYNAAGQLTRVASVSGSTALQSVAYSYNAAGDVTGVTDGQGRTVVFEYDANGNQTLQRDAAGNTVTRTFNARNQVLTETAYVVADPDGAGAAQPSLPLTTRYVYDEDGRNLLRFALSPEGRVTEYRYDSWGQRTASLSFTGGTYAVGALAATAVPTLAQMTAWVGNQILTNAQRVDMAYDARGMLLTTTVWGNTNYYGDGVNDGTQSVTRYVYDQAGLLLQTVSPAQGTTLYTYDGLGRVLTSTDAQGVVTVTRHDDANNRTSVTLVNGLVTTQTFDRAGRLVSVAQTDAAARQLGQTQYSYDRAGRLRMTQDPTGVQKWMLYDDAGRKVADIDGNGSLVEYVLNADGQITRRVEYATAVDVSRLVDATGQPVILRLDAVRPASGAGDLSTWYAYDAAGRLVKTVDGTGAVTQTFYDGASRVVKVRQYATRISTASLGNAPTPDAIAPVANDADRVTRTLYDQDGRVVGELDAEGYLTEHQYDAAGRHVGTMRYATRTNPALWAEGTLAQLHPAPAAGDIRNVTLYDGQGRVIAELDGENYLTERVYDVSGNLVRQVRYHPALKATVMPGTPLASIRPLPGPGTEQQVTSWAYDALNRVTRMTNAEGTVTEYVYDAVGNLVTTRRAVGQAEVRSLNARYDVQGRLVGELSAEGGALLTGNQTQEQIGAIWAQHGIKHTYDLAGRRTSTTDQNGLRTLFFYNVDGQLTHTVNPLGEVVEQRYNALGQLEATVRYNGRVSLPGLNGGLAGTPIANAIAAIANASLDSRTAFAYDRAGRLATRTEALTRGTSAVTRFSYDAFGAETARITDIGNGLQRFDITAYDRRGLQVMSVADATGKSVLTSATYDAFGRQDSVVDANGRSSKTFDRLGRVVSTTDRAGALRRTTFDAFDRVLTQVDALGQETRYAYDTAARSVTVTTPEGVSVVTTHDRHGQTLSIRDGNKQVTRYTYDRDGRLTGATTPLTGTSQSYDRAGRLIETLDARGTKVAYTYDGANRVLKREVDPGGLALATRYEYDGKGQQVRVTDPEGIVTLTQFDLAGRTTTQTVDEGGLNLRTSYGYDLVGNILTVTSPRGTQTTYTYDKLGRRESESVNLGDKQLVTRYTYDNAGNVVARVDANNQTTRFTYDAENRLQFTVDAAGNTSRNEYDAEGRITRTTRYAKPLAMALLAAKPTSEQVLALVTASPGRDAVQANRYDRDGRLRFTVDGTGAVREMRYDANGNVIERVAYANAINVGTWDSKTTDPAVTPDATRDQRVRTVYDALNRATHEANALGEVTERVYDGNGNVLRLVQRATRIGATDSPSSAKPDAADRVNVFVYDRANRETWRADAAGAVTRSEYDKDGNLLSSTRFDATITAGGDPSTVKPNAAADRVTRHTYDRAGRRTHTVDAMNFVTRWVYDLDGNVSSSTRFDTPITAGALPTSVAAAPTLDQTDTYVRDAAGRVLSHTDAMGYTESYTYDGLGNKLTFTNKKGSVWTYAYDAAGRLLQETSPGVAVAAVAASNGALVPGTIEEAGIVTRFEYDGLGNLLSRIEALGRPEARQTNYEYDAAGRQVLVSYPKVGVYNESPDALAANGLSAVASRAEADRVLTTRTFYDALGNAVANVDVGNGVSYKAYDTAGRMLWEVDALGYVTGYTRNAFGEATDVLRFAKNTTLADAVPTSASQAPTAAKVAAAVAALDHTGDRLLTTRYDALGRAVEVTEPATFNYDSATGHYSVAAKTTRHTYNAFGDLTKTRQMGEVPVDAWFYYDKLGRQVATVDALGYVTQREFDAAGNLTRQTEFGNRATAGSWTDTQVATPAKADDDRVTTYTYDQANRKTSQTLVGARLSEGAGGKADVVTRYGYDAVGNLTRTTDATGANVYSYYDALGRVTAVAEPARPGADGLTVTPLSIFLRDAHGNVTLKIDKVNGAAAASEFTGVSRLSNPGFVMGEGSTQDRVTATQFDLLGRAVVMTDAQGITRYSSYDAFGKLAKNWQTLVVDNATNTLYQAFQYDKLGRLTHTFDPAPHTSAGAPSGGNTTTRLEYDAFGEVLRKSVNGQVQEFSEYDAAGRVWRTNRGDGVVKVYLYDVLGRNTAEISSSGLDDLAAADMVAARAANLTTTRRTDITYDALGRVVARVLPQRLETQGGVTVYSRTTSVQVLDVSQIPDDGRNQVNLKWSTLARLGTGDIRVEIEYNTATTDLLTEPEHRSYSRVFTAEQASAGVDLFWVDQSGRRAAEVTKLTVWKEDVNGQWQRVISQDTFGFAGNTVEVVVPDDPNTHMRVDMRPVNGTWAEQVGINFGNALHYDASRLGIGDYEYRVFTDRLIDGVKTSVITASGTLQQRTPPLAAISIPIGYGPAGEGVLAWQTPGSGVKQVLNYRRANSMEGWTSLAVTSRSLTHDGVDTSALASGNYEFELLWTRDAESLPYAHAMGSFTVVAARPAVEVPPAGVPNVTGVTVTGTSVSWDTKLGAGRALSDTTLGYVSGFESTATSLSWVPANGGTVELKGRVVGTPDWAPIPVTLVNGRHRIDTSALPGGDYEFLVTYTENGAVTAAGRGQLKAQQQPSLTNTTATHITDFQASATAVTWTPAQGEPVFEYRRSGISFWTAIGIGTLGGKAGVNIDGLPPDTYEFRVSYAKDGVDTACGGGTLTVQAGAAPTLSNLGAGQLGQITCTNAVLSWPTVVGKVAAQGRPVGSTKWVDLTVRSANGTDSIDLSGVEAGTYEFRIAYTDTNRTVALGGGKVTLYGGGTVSGVAASQVVGFGATANALTWTPPAGVSISAGTLFYRTPGASKWESIPLSAMGDKHGVDITGVAGTFDFRVVYMEGDKITSFGSGRLSATAPSTTQIPGNVTFVARVAGTSTWSNPLPVTVSGERASVNFAEQPPGEYEFRIVYTADGKQVALGTGSATFHAPVPAHTPAPTLSASTLPRIPSTSYSVTSTTLRWTGLAGTARVEWRLVGGSTWSVGDAAKDGTSDWVSISELVPGQYEFRISYPVDGDMVTVGAGNLTVHPATQTTTPKPTLSNTSLPNVTGFVATTTALTWNTVSGSTALFEGRKIGVNTWEEMPVVVSGATSSVNITGLLPGDYEFRVSYSNGTALTAFGAANAHVSEFTQPAPTLGSTTASAITGLSADGNTLSWNAAAGKVYFDYRDVNNNGNWVLGTGVEVADLGNGRHGKDIGGLNGRFDYRIRYETPGGITSLAMGRLDAVTPTPVLGNTTQANVTNVTATRSTLSWDKNAGTPKLDWRPANSTGEWLPLTVSPGTARDSYDISGLGAGSYQFRVSYTDPSGLVTSMALSTLTVAGPSTVNNTAGAIVTGVSANGNTLSWNATAGKAYLDYRDINGNGSWVFGTGVEVVDMGNGRHGKDIGGLNGSFEYRIRYESAGVITALGMGRLDASTPTPALSATTQANVTNMTVTNSTLSWDKNAGTPKVQWRVPGTQAWNDLGVPVTTVGTRDSVEITGVGQGTYEFRVFYETGGEMTSLAVSTLTVPAKATSNLTAGYVVGFNATPTLLSWTRNTGTPFFEYRLGTGNWAQLTVVPGGAGDSVNITGAPAGTYDFRVTYSQNGTVTALGTGQLYVPYVGANPSLSNTNQSYVTGVSANAGVLTWNKAGAAMPTVYKRLVNTSDWGTPLTVTQGATQDNANIAGLAPGNYEFRIVYWSGGKESALATGNLVISPNSLGSTTSTNVIGYQADTYTLSWVPLAGTEKFELWNGTGWAKRDAVALPGGRRGVDMHGMSGTYKFRITYTDSAGSTTGFGSGVFTAAPATMTPSGTTKADVTGISLSAGVLSWNKPANGGTATLYRRLANTSDWGTALTVTPGATRDSADVSALSGNYEFRIVYTTGTLVTAVGTGTLQMTAAPVLGSTTGTNVTGYQTDVYTLSWVPLAGTETFKYWTGTEWKARDTIALPGGRRGVDVRGVSGTVNFRITYTNGAGETTGLGSGVFTAAPATMTPSNTAQANVTGFTATATRLSWAIPPAGTVQVQRRLANSTEWVPMSATLVDGKHGVDLSGLALGEHEFRITYSQGTMVTAMALARLTVLAPVATVNPALSAVNVPQISGFDNTATQLSWAAVAGTATFESRLLGAKEWTVRTVTTANGRSAVDITGLPVGQYEFRVMVHSGSALTARGAGNFTTYAPVNVAPTPTLSNTAVANVAGIAVSPTQLSWIPAAGTVVFEYRVVGTSTWAKASPGRVGTGTSARDTIDLAGLPVGRYEFRMSYTATNGAVNALGSGVVTVYAPVDAYTPAPTVVITTPPYAAGYTIPAAPGSYASSTSEPKPYAVSLSGSNLAYVLTQTPGTGSDSAWLRPRIEQKLDRWGNVLETNDPRSLSWKTTYRWNVNNQMIFQQRPTGDGAAGGAVTQVSYDALGRQVAVQDALGNVNRQAYDAGGHLVREEHADGGAVTHRYDAFGDKVQTVDAVGNAAGASAAVREGHTTRFTYDKLGQLKRITHGEANVYTAAPDSPMTLSSVKRNIEETFDYDEAGRKIRQTNGNGEITHYRYDFAGHVISKGSSLGTITRYGYDAFGHKNYELDANGDRPLSWVTDYWGRTLKHVDLGQATVTYEYDKNTRQLVSQKSTRGQDQRFSYDAAGQLVKIEEGRLTDGSAKRTTLYAYDLAGNHVLERTVQEGIVYQDNHLAYDALGRLRDVADGRVHISFAYDLDGNRTFIGTHVNMLREADDLSESVSQDSKRYFQYDSMNRQVVVDAEDEHGTLGKQGHRVGYDANGNRVRDEFWGNRVVTNGGETVIVGYNDDSTAIYDQVPYTYRAEEGLVTEEYRYDNLDRLVGVERDKVQVDVRRYDGAGRVVASGPANLPKDFAKALNENVPQAKAIGLDQRRTRYDAEGKVAYQNVYNSDGTLNYALDYSAGYDKAGNLRTYKMRNASGSVTETYEIGLTHYEGYVQATSKVTSASRGVSGTTTSVYDENGQLVKIDDSNDANDRTFKNDAQGRALLADQGGHVQRQLIVNGENLGRFGVGVNELQPRGRNGDPQFKPVAEFSFGYQPINGNYPGTSPGAYEVRQGDTLQSIARGAYGDSQLWYRIAEANGLSGDRDLRVGQTLTIPTIAGTAHNDFDTFKPYDPSKITGDTTPTLPAPPSKGGCGALGAIIVAIVIIVVAVVSQQYYLANYATATTATGATVTGATASSAVAAGTASYTTGSLIAAGAISGAAGAVAGQLVGNAIGIYDGFDWKAVALGALGGAVTGGLGNWNVGTDSAIANAAVRSAVANAMTQGVAVATGLQDKFNWKGVAAAAVGSATGAALGKEAGIPANATEKFLKDAAVNLASGTVAAAVRGGHVSMRQVAVDAFGNALADGFVNELRDAALPDSVRAMSLTARAQAHGLMQQYRIDAGNATEASNLTDMVRMLNEQGAVTDQRRAELTDFALTKRGLTDAQRADVMALARSEGVLPSPELAAASEPGAIQVPVVGTKGSQAAALLTPAVDTLAKRTGYFVQDVAQYVGERPWLKVGLEVLNVMAAPVAYSVGKVIEASPAGEMIKDAQARVTGAISQRFSDVGYDDPDSMAGGIGAMAVASAVAGWGAAKVLSFAASAVRTRMSALAPDVSGNPFLADKALSRGYQDGRPRVPQPGTSFAMVGNVKILPQTYERLYHGGSLKTLGLPEGISPQKAAEHLYNNGLPGRGTNIDLLQHQRSHGDSAYRGTTTTPFLQDRHAGGAGQWANDGDLVVELANRRGYDVNAAIEFNNPSLFERLNGNPLRGELEIATPAQVLPEGISRVGIRTTAPNGAPRIDWIPRP